MPDAGAPTIKCVVWDLDNTLWDGVLLEDKSVTVRAGVVAAMRELDRRGMLQSVASKNDYRTARDKLVELGLWDLFLYPQIHWNPKSSSMRQIATALNIALDTFAFVDDQAFERDEVAAMHDEVLCFDVTDVEAMLEHRRLTPSFITSESSMRRRLYQADHARAQAQEECTGTDEEFLASLGLKFEIRSATDDDLQRAEELTVRTNQLNSTGYTYSYDELSALRQFDDHVLLVASLEDRYGAYGTIGISLVEKTERYWVIKLLLMSCRVMSRGVGTVMLGHIMAMARDAGVRLRAEFVPTDRNRVMYITYKFAGFEEVDAGEPFSVLETDLARISPPPSYVELIDQTVMR